MSEDTRTEALEQYERQAAALRANLARVVHGWDALPIQQVYFPLLREIGAEQRAAEERDRREWTESVRRRLGLVAEVHRCWVWQSVGLWHWWCLRDSCGAAHHNLLSQPEAFADALAHARSFAPQPPEPRALSHLDWTVLASFHDYISGVAVPPLVGAGLDLTGWGPQA